MQPLNANEFHITSAPNVHGLFPQMYSTSNQGVVCSKTSILGLVDRCPSTSSNPVFQTTLTSGYQINSQTQLANADGNSVPTSTGAEISEPLVHLPPTLFQKNPPFMKNLQPERKQLYSLGSMNFVSSAQLVSRPSANAPIYTSYFRAHSTRASPVTIQWLLDNYEAADGVSLSRSALYSHYLAHCLEHWLEPMNPASFGKLVRSVFVGLRTRRLGTRGNSKYHYYGIRMKTDSILNRLPLEAQGQAKPKRNVLHPGRASELYVQKQQNTSNNGCIVSIERTPMFQKQEQRISNSPFGKQIWRGWDSNSSYTSSNHQTGGEISMLANLKPWPTSSSCGILGLKTTTANFTSTDYFSGTDHLKSQNNQRTTFKTNMTRNFTVDNLDELCRIAGIVCKQEDEFYATPCIQDYRIYEKALGFVEIYAVHCEEVYEMIMGLQLDELRALWHQFWRSNENHLENNEKGLTKADMMSICDESAVCHFVELADRTLYQAMLEVIIEDSLNAMPSNLIQGLRVLLKMMEPCLRSAIRQFNPSLINTKLTALSGFTKGLRRALGLTHLSQAVVQALQDPERLIQMRNDISKVDLNSIEAQGSWASTSVGYINNFNGSLHLGENHADSRMKCGNLLEHVSTSIAFGLEPHQPSDFESTNICVTKLHDELCELLDAQASLKDWTNWLDRIVSRSLAPRGSGPKRANAARQLMLVWNYYSSLLMRELTLRSATSFSSCHLLRMLCDEYLSYRLEQVASSPLTPLPRYQASKRDEESGIDVIHSGSVKQTTSLTNRDRSDKYSDTLLQCKFQDHVSFNMPDTNDFGTAVQRLLEKNSKNLSPQLQHNHAMSAVESNAGYLDSRIFSDPVLTDSTTLLEEKPLTCDNEPWPMLDAPMTAQMPSFNFGVLDSVLTPTSSEADYEYGSMSNFCPPALNDSEPLDLNMNYSAALKASDSAIYSKKPRAGRKSKLHKPSRLSVRDVNATFDCALDADSLHSIETIKMEEEDWLSEMIDKENIMIPKATWQNEHHDTCQRFLKPKSERRIIASLSSDSVQVTSVKR